MGRTTDFLLYILVHHLASGKFPSQNCNRELSGLIADWLGIVTTRRVSEGPTLSGRPTR